VKQIGIKTWKKQPEKSIAYETPKKSSGKEMHQQFKGKV